MDYDIAFFTFPNVCPSIVAGVLPIAKRTHILYIIVHITKANAHADGSKAGYPQPARPPLPAPLFLVFRFLNARLPWAAPSSPLEGLQNYCVQEAIAQEEERLSCFEEVDRTWNMAFCSLSGRMSI